MTGELLALAAMLMFATNILVTKAASSRLDTGTGFVISVVVNLAFSALVFVVELALRPDRLAWDATGIVLFMLAGASATYLGRWFFFEAIARLGPARASLFHVSSPAFTLVIAWLFLGESPGLAAVLAIAATIVGLLLITVPPGMLRIGQPVAGERAARGERLRRWLASGFAVGVGATFAYAVGNVLRGASVRQWNEPVAGAMLGAAAALVLQLVIGADKRGLLARLRTGNRAGARLYAVGGVLTISAQMCMIASMRYIPVAITAVITLCTPLVVMPVSYWVLRNQERIGVRTLVGAALTIAGMAVVVLR
jgi:drug/metabolite transporter (DMT)-like permease